MYIVLMMVSLMFILVIVLSVGCYGLRFSPSMSLTPKTPSQFLKKDVRVVAEKAGVLPAVLAFSRTANAKLDFDQKEYENRPDALDAAPPIGLGIQPNWKKLKGDLTEYVLANPNKGPTLVRLAWHSSGTYDKISKTGGSSKGTIRFKEELAHGANAGLDLAVAWMEPFYKKYNKDADLSYGDLYTLAGVVAIEALKGPSIPWRAGRKDSFDPSDVTPDGRLPAADKGDPMSTANGLRDVFYRMGFDDREIVALSGAHALGRCHATASGYVGPWVFTPTTFNNQYFVLLKGLEWTEAKTINNKPPIKFQYTDPTGKLMMLPSDIVLLTDPSFKKYVDEYAKDNKKFFKDFSAAFIKLTELGTSGLVDVNV